MRIAVIGLRGFPNIQGGVESHCENIIPRLGPDFHCTVYRRKPYLNRHSTVSFNNISFIDLPSTRIKGFEAVFHTFLAVVHIILHHNCDIVNIHNIGPGLFTPILRLFGYKVVITYHSPNYEHSKWGKMSRAIFKIGEKVSLRYANRIIFVNKFQQEKLSEKIFHDSVFIPNGINEVTRSTRTDFLEKHGLTPKRYILAVGRLTPEKGFDTLIKAINQCDTSLKLVIAGASDNGSNYEESLRKLDTNDKVIFTGFTKGEQLRQLYSHAGLFILSSINEGFPIVLLEAMSYKLPVIVTDLPATHMVQLPSEVYTRAGDVDMMKNKISDFCKGKMTDTQYHNMEQFNWENIAQSTAKVYNSLN